MAGRPVSRSEQPRGNSKGVSDMEKGFVKFFDNRDNKRFGFLRLETGEEIFFHFNDGAVPQAGVGQPELVEGVLKREPRKYDSVVFERSHGRKGDKASPWAFAEDYDRANAATKKFEPTLKVGNMSMTYEYMDERYGLTRCILSWEGKFGRRAWGIPAPSFEVETPKLHNRSGLQFETDEHLARILSYPLPEEMKKEARERFSAYNDAVERRKPHLLKILHDVLGDTTVEMDKDYEHSCVTIFEIDNDTHWGIDSGYAEPRAKARYREIYGTSPLIRRYWEPKTSSSLRRWYPGGHSGSGFLGWGEKLEEVIAEDADTLARLGKTHDEVGLKVKEVLDAASPLWSIDNSKAAIDIGDYEVRLQYWMGYQTCPFEGCEYGDKMCPHSSCDFQITNKKTGEVIEGPGMIWHLISAHKFFEGKKTHRRVDPEQLVKVIYGS